MALPTADWDSVHPVCSQGGDTKMEEAPAEPQSEVKADATSEVQPEAEEAGKPGPTESAGASAAQADTKDTEEVSQDLGSSGSGRLQDALEFVSVMLLMRT